MLHKVHTFKNREFIHSFFSKYLLVSEEIKTTITAEFQNQKLVPFAAKIKILSITKSFPAIGEQFWIQFLKANGCNQFFINVIFQDLSSF